MLLQARARGWPSWIIGDGFPVVLVDQDDGDRVIGHATSREAFAALVRLVRSRDE